MLDVGGYDFFLTARARGVPFATWTTLEPAQDRALPVADPRFRLAHGDGCAMGYADGSFDTVVNLQVLEHVMDPARMVAEIARVLKPGGHAVFLIPQTSVLHMAPDHYYNFTRYWIEEAMRRAGLELVELRPLGGVWSTAASRFVYFFLQAFRVEGYSPPVIRRGLAFYALLPLMVLYALLSIPVCLLLSLGDLAEEPNNHLAVARKPSRS